MYLHLYYVAAVELRNKFYPHFMHSVATALRLNVHVAHSEQQFSASMAASLVLVVSNGLLLLLKPPNDKANHANH